jgi:thiol-disulfide isomerase/thioredoxin
MKYLILILFPVLMSCSAEPGSRDTQKKADRLEDYAGRYLLINYWAEWCHPCLEEIPELNMLARDHGDKISVIGVNFDGLEAEEISLQQRRLGIDFAVVTEDPAIHFRYNRPEVLPTSYLFDPAQELVATLVGPQTRESILALIKGLEQTD